MLNPHSTTAYLITKPEHVFYLTNFDGEGFVIVDEKGVMLATDQRYWLLAKKVKNKGVKLFDLKGQWTEELNRMLMHVRTFFFEEEHLTVAGLNRWEHIFKGRIWKKSEGVV